MRPAWKFLRTAHDSTAAILESFEARRRANKDAIGKTHGRLSADEMDLLRAAIVFTSSGMDASLQRLVRDTLPALIAVEGSGARAKYQKFLTEQLRLVKPMKEFSAAVLGDDPARELVKAYVDMRTKASYLGIGDLTDRVRETLGLSRTAVPEADIYALEPFFLARNAIVHRMDYVDAAAPKSRKRHPRMYDATVSECDLAFDVVSRLILESANLMRRK